MENTSTKKEKDRNQREMTFNVPYVLYNEWSIQGVASRMNGLYNEGVGGGGRSGVIGGLREECEHGPQVT